jgi:hypothetical protein
MGGLAVGLGIAGAACGDAGSGAAPGGSAAARSSTTRAQASTSAAASAAPSAAPRARAAMEGDWSGTYRSEKGSVTLEKTVKDKAWSAESDSRGVGSGTIRITVSAGGEVGGEIEAPLGPAALSGHVEGDRLTATFAARGE